MKFPKSTLVALALVIACVAFILPARGMINPNFTPVHLVRQSSLILELQFGTVADNKATATVKRVLKGTYAGKTLVLNLGTSAFPEQAKQVATLADSKEPVAGIFFAGEIGEGAAGGGGGDAGGAPAPGDAAAPAGETANQKAFLHLNGTWVSFAMGKNKEWELVQLAESMNPTWNGATDMLIAATDYILADPDADVPVKEGINWASSGKFAQIAGAVHAAMPVDLAGDGKLTLYVACEGGDHLFKYDSKSQNLADVTAAAKLTAKSKVSTWGDFNADGKMDLLSYDGTSLTIYTQQADGTFQAGTPVTFAELKGGCLSLSVIDSGKPGHPAVVMGTHAVPVLWTPGEPPAAIPIPADNITDWGVSGAAGPTLVADLDNDGNPDILVPFEKGSFIYPGKGAGQFDSPKPCPVTLGRGTASAFLGDFDGDGLLDIFTAASDSASHLWSNKGKFNFADTMAFTGELAYKGGNGAIGGTTGDFNNDGRQDVLFWYAAAAPHLYFNRGFRTFGLANNIDPGAGNAIPNAEDGGQAGCFADLNGDGAQDVILIMKNGDAWAFYPEAGDGAARAARGVLAANGPHIGPVTVTGYRNGRSLGAWNVQAGTAEAFVGVMDAGPVSLKFQFPGGQPQEKKVIVENKPVRALLEAVK